MANMNKKFSEWIDVKEKLHEKNMNVPYVNQGDIWWASVGENIGQEVNGKNKEFSRPIIILKKLAFGFYFVIPVTTRPKYGTWYVPFYYNKRSMIACLHQSRAMDYRRLWSRMGELDSDDFSRIKAGFKRLYP